MATLNTRLKLKYDSYTNWSAEANQFVLLKGEVAFCYIPDAIDAVHNPPTLMYKVGDGAKTFNELSWGSALASDVYNWAKQQYAPVASLAGTSGVVVTKTAANAHTVKADLKDYTKSANAATKATANANKTYAVELDKDGHLAVVVPWTDNNTNTAHTHTAGIGLKVTGSGGVSGTTTYKAALASETKNTARAGTGKLYAVEADADGNLAVNVPWTDDNTTYTFTEGATNGAFSVTPSDGDTASVKIHGLKSAAYTESSAYATAAQGTAADNAMPKTGGTFTGEVTVQAPTKDMHPATKKYVDSAISGVTQFKYEIKASYADLGTASANTMGKIFLVPHSHNPNDGKPDSYDEYITIDKGASASPRYTWERIGNTDIDLSEYVNDLSGAANKGVVTNLTKSGNTLTVTSADISSTNSAGSGKYISGITQDKTGKITSVATGSLPTFTDTNQKVKVGDTTFGADAEVKLVAGSNVTITPKTSDNAITISATDTKPNNGKLKDGTGIEIFSANSSADVQILVIDCGSATEVKYTVE